MTKSYEVRPLEISDRAAWEPLWAGYLEFYKTTVPGEVTEATWARLIDPDGPFQGFCAAREDALLGVVHFLFHPVTWAVGPRCYLEDLFVAPDARCMGVARALIEAVYDAADAAGADQVYWLTQEDNHTARALYDKIGRATDFIKYQR
ncbi:MAG: GNAT family N-acetyltransferase [Maricaulaceae bacterium]|jgi:ribosomal protein S18 acetylase RimI-like enzyme